MFDMQGGVANRIADTNYNTRDSPVHHSDWVDFMIVQYSAFNHRISTANLPQNVVQQMWQQAVNAGDRAMLEGFTKVGKQCTGYGRELMNYDCSSVASKLRSSIPVRDGEYIVLPNFPNCQFFVQGYYIGWADLNMYLMTHAASLGRERVEILIELVGTKERRGVKEIKTRKQEVVEQLATMQIG
eukprot:TRINITY_DN25871_c0_g1_i2.p2 TRINITY_DN25871_c0_g1~~TRINITY_DN25871_c0_g1_i2.p2  ORF type:complete len:185 (-),score=36.90 TRINITY_DN25871_c0_g1_i2:886-1440(-)